MDYLDNMKLKICEFEFGDTDVSPKAWVLKSVILKVNDKGIEIVN